LCATEATAICRVSCLDNEISYFCYMNFAVYAQQYQQDLRQRLIPFWTAFGLDTLNGGYFCVISAKGEPVSSDKWIAWHAHQSWAFAKLYQQFSQPEHLDYARVGADFLLHGDPKTDFHKIDYANILLAKFID